MESDIELARKRAWRIFFAIVLTLAFVAAGLWHWGRPVYQHIKEKHLAAEAGAYFEKGDYRNATMSARLALMLNSSNLPACRIMADVSEMVHAPMALDWRQRVAEIEPTATNRLALAATALTFQNRPFPLTAEILNQLGSTTATNLATYHAVATLLALRLNRTEEAEQHMAAALTIEPTNRSFAMNLAVLQLNSTNPAVTQAARRTLEEFCTDTNLGPAALRSLISERILHKDLAGAREYSTQLLGGSRAEFSDQLQSLDILNKLADPGFESRLKTVQQQASTNAFAAAQMAAWMQANSRADAAAEWLRSLPVEVQSQPPAQIALAEYYLNSANWTQLCKQTAKGDWEERDFLRLAFLARAWDGLGEPLVSASHWRSAVMRSEGKLGALNLLLNFAQRWGQPAAMEFLLNDIVQKQPEAIWAQLALEQFYVKTGNTAKLYQFYRTRLAEQPKNIALKNNIAATGLLLKTNLAEAEQWALELNSQRPGDPVITSTYAYALHLQGRDAEGLALFQRLPADRLEDPSLALYYGVLLRTAGQRAQAAHYLAIAERSPNLLPEEKALLKGE